MVVYNYNTAAFCYPWSELSLIHDTAVDYRTTSGSLCTLKAHGCDCDIAA